MKESGRFTGSATEHAGEREGGDGTVVFCGGWACCEEERGGRGCSADGVSRDIGRASPWHPDATVLKLITSRMRRSARGASAARDCPETETLLVTPRTRNRRKKQHTKQTTPPPTHHPPSLHVLQSSRQCSPSSWQLPDDRQGGQRGRRRGERTREVSAVSGGERNDFTLQQQSYLRETHTEPRPTPDRPPTGR